MTRLTRWQVTQRQANSLEVKVRMTRRRLRSWYEYHGGDVYVSFSGGQDSTVLLDIARNEYPGIPAVFLDTGLEYPEIRAFVRTVGDVTWVKPTMTFPEVLTTYGYPIVSKEQAEFIREYRTMTDRMREIRLHGNNQGRGIISHKWRYLIDAPFKISEQCCNIMKKRPARRYEKATGRAPIFGTLAEESSQRIIQYMRFGCNVFNAVRPSSRPMMFWQKQDVQDYIQERNLDYSSIYDMGYERTGCMFCLFGLHFDSHPTRLELMERTHPKTYRYLMEKLNYRAILEWYPERKEA